ncbi:MAG: heavy metal translocating P-type ATPase metal-binding domain-containing protein [Bacteroidia bacterium]|jgi:Cu+-exporting ATPase|nr:heavy metal translocating P-type ATPase metal-binding domain-containing protein [Bacteroidia bacterium]
MATNTHNTTQAVTCFHCGDNCVSTIMVDVHSFCCAGCKSVYLLLSQNNLCGYYQIENAPGTTQLQPVMESAFAYLDDEKVTQQLLAYKDQNLAKVTFFIPTMHCSSCIWLLEHLYKLDTGVLQAKVQFLKKELSLSFNPQQTSLRKLVILLSKLGYEPSLSLNDLEKRAQKDYNKKLSYQIGVAGFCFGNIMLISFPEYFGLDQFTQSSFSKLFGYINFVLSLPVFLFSAQDYFKSAWNGLRKKHISIDVPLALGILVMFARSSYEVISGNGIGWFDTHAGLVFFLLIGKWFQQKTFDTLSFERDYKSYFPVAVTVLKNEASVTVPVTTLHIGDRIQIRNNELIPADAILLKGNAQIDFSFVTGESLPVSKELGEIVYAGGRQKGATIELEVCKKVSQSYLTQLWNNDTFTKNNQSAIESFQQQVSRYFTIALLAIAFGSAGWWLANDSALALNAFTAVLIIACPCALALSSPFALGTAMRLLGRNQFYVKSPAVVEQMAHMDTVVFDKTGTLTQPSEAQLAFVGNPLTLCQQKLIASVVAHSVHPLSQKIKQFMGTNQLFQVTRFDETTGKGIEATIQNHVIRIGSEKFVNQQPMGTLPTTLATRVFVAIDNYLLGYFEFKQAYRNGLSEVMQTLNSNYSLYLLSGDNSSEQNQLLPYFQNPNQLLFNQTPAAKLDFIQSLQHQQHKVMMVGDGLNDAGALKAAHVGISITENTAHFSPASDVIMSATVFESLPRFLQFARATRRVIHASFVISLLYNIVGLSYAVQGTLSPLFAAILMPISSVTVIAFTTISTSLLAKKGGLQ